MICYVLAMGKQHLGPHVVVGYGIKTFWLGLFITSPDHLVLTPSREVDTQQTTMDQSCLRSHLCLLFLLLGFRQQLILFSSILN